MSIIRIANLLDDFALGGVTKGLTVYDDPAFAGVIKAQTVPIRPDAVFAPRIDADIIITHFPPNWRRIAFLSSLRRRNPQARIVHVEHSYSADWEAMYVPNAARFRLMLKLALAQVHHVVAVSQAVGEWMTGIGATRGDRMTVIYPYSGKKGLDAVPDMVLPETGKPVIGTYGRFAEAKGYDTLIKAMRLLGDDAPFDLMIGGMGQQEAELRDLAGDAPNIRFVGRVDDVAAFLAQCHVFAVPSRFEAYGQVANEAREAGRPILVSHAGGLPEQVGRAGIIADCRTPEALAEAIATLPLHDLEAMGRAGRAATAHCGEDRIAQWIKLFRFLTVPSGLPARNRRSLDLSTA